MTTSLVSYTTSRDTIQTALATSEIGGQIGAIQSANRAAGRGRDAGFRFRRGAGAIPMCLEAIRFEIETIFGKYTS